MGKLRNAKNILVGKPECKILLSRTRRRWDDNIKIYVKKMVS
jgi:hypothetical protein